MAKILILNGSHSELPLIRAARKLGLHVTTTGNNPRLIGHQISDNYVERDFSNKEEVLLLAKELKIDFICSCANDMGLMSATYTAEILGLPGHDTLEVAEKIHLKDHFKDYCKNKPIFTPSAAHFSSPKSAIEEIEKLSYPLIIKPSDMSGGKGVSKVLAPSEYANAVELAFTKSPSKQIVIEPFIEGSQHSFSTFVAQGRVQLYFSDNEYSTVNPYTVSTSSAPASCIDTVQEELLETASFLASDMQLVDGLLHFQFILNNNRAHILEITRRCSGDLYPYPVSLALGVDWAELIVLASMGECPKELPQSMQTGFVGRHCIMAERNGRIRQFDIPTEFEKYIVSQEFAFKSGDNVTDFMAQKLAVLILKFESAEEMRLQTQAIQENCKVVLF